MSGLQRAPLSLMTIQLLIICWVIDIYNLRDILSLMILMMGHPIPHLLILTYHHRHSLHLQIILKREIYLERELKLSLSANSSANNGLDQCGKNTGIVKLNVCNLIDWIGVSIPSPLVHRPYHQCPRKFQRRRCVVITSSTSEFLVIMVICCCGSLRLEINTQQLLILRIFHCLSTLLLPLTTVDMVVGRSIDGNYRVITQFLPW